MLKMSYILVVVASFCILPGMLLAQRSGISVTISGEQIRGVGTDGQLRSTPVRISGYGHITGVRYTDSSSFWMECKSNCQGTKKFSMFDDQNYQNWRIPPGNWAVYPSLRQGKDKSGVTVTIEFGQ